MPEDDPAETETNASEAPPAGATQALGRDVAALVATADQHSAELDAINVQLAVLVFALGALAGVVFLQHRELRSLAHVAG